MNCYFLRHDRSEEELDKMEVFYSYVPLSLEYKDKIYESVKRIVDKDGLQNSQIYIVTEDELTAIETALAVNHSLGLTNNNISVDERLNRRKIEKDDKFGLKSEKKRNYTARISDAMTEIIMTHRNDDVIIFVAGDHLFKTCQSNDFLHTLMYFGDEYLISPFDITNQALALNEFINYEIGIQFASQCLKSQKRQKPFELEKVILEAPEINEQGNVKPVYLKYAENKLSEKIEAQKDIQKGE